GLLPAIDEDALAEAIVADQTLGKTEPIQALRQDQCASQNEVLATRLQADKLAPLGVRASDQISQDPPPGFHGRPGVVDPERGIDRKALVHGSQRGEGASRPDEAV